MQLSTSSLLGTAIKLEAKDEQSAEKAKLFIAAFGLNVHRAGTALLIGELDLSKLDQLNRPEI